MAGYARQEGRYPGYGQAAAMRGAVASDGDRARGRRRVRHRRADRARSLTDEGHRVLTAANGKQGLEVLAKERPDLVFLDYMMPVMDGAAMLRGMAQTLP